MKVKPKKVTNYEQYMNTITAEDRAYVKGFMEARKKEDEKYLNEKISTLLILLVIKNY